MQTSAVSRLEAHSCFPLTNPAIDSVSPVGSWLLPFPCPGLASCGAFFPVRCLTRRYQSRIAQWVTVGNENVSVRLPNPCALVVERLLLNTTWRLKIAVEGCVGEMKTFYLSVVMSGGLAEMETASPKSAIRHLHSGQLART